MQFNLKHRRFFFWLNCLLMQQSRLVTAVHVWIHPSAYGGRDHMGVTMCMHMQRRQIDACIVFPIAVDNNECQRILSDVGAAAPSIHLRAMGFMSVSPPCMALRRFWIALHCYRIVLNLDNSRSRTWSNLVHTQSFIFPLFAVWLKPLSKMHMLVRT